jgi:predicted DNA binding CopG/RHH family protein
MARKRLNDAPSEAEEALWFEANQERLLKMFEQASKKGQLRVGDRSVAITISKQTGELKRPASQKVMLRIPEDDLARARKQAAQKGIGYQTYIKMLLRIGLDREEVTGAKS